MKKLLFLMIVISLFISIETALGQNSILISDSTNKIFLNTTGINTTRLVSDKKGKKFIVGIYYEQDSYGISVLKITKLISEGSEWKVEKTIDANYGGRYTIKIGDTTKLVEINNDECIYFTYSYDLFDSKVIVFNLLTIDFKKSYIVSFTGNKDEAYIEKMTKQDMLQKDAFEEKRVLESLIKSSEYSYKELKIEPSNSKSDLASEAKSDLDTIFNIQNYLSLKYSKNPITKIEEDIELDRSSNYIKMKVNQIEYFYQEVVDADKFVKGYNILGAVLPVYNDNDGGKRIIQDPHYISANGKFIRKNIFLQQNQTDYKYTILLKPKFKDPDYYDVYLNYIIEEISVTIEKEDSNFDIVFSKKNNTAQFDNNSDENNDSKIIQEIEVLPNCKDNQTNTDCEPIFKFIYDSGECRIYDLNGYPLNNSFFSDVEYLKKINQLDYFLVKTDSKYGIIKSNGLYLFEPNFKSLEVTGLEFEQNGIGKVEYNGKVGLIDKNFNFILEPEFTDLRFTTVDNTNAIVKIKPHEYYQSEYWDFINLKTKKLRGYKFEEIEIQIGNRIAVKKNKKWGICNKTGDVLLEPKYDFIGNFNENLAIAANYYGVIIKKMTRSIFIINSNGIVVSAINEIIANDIDIVSSFYDGLLKFKSKRTGMFGFLDIKGNVVIKPIYEEADYFYKGKCNVKRFGTSFTIDKSGNRLND